MHYEEKGLSGAEARRILESEGENVLSKGKKHSVAAMFFSQFKDLMILILAAATLVSALMGETAEAIAIIVIVLVNALMGFLQEYRTEKTLEALNELSAPMARVRRDGREQAIPTAHVVTGDLLILEAGDKIPADARIVQAVQLSCDESMLTGESLPMRKKAQDNIFMGCTVLTGHAAALVTKTGMRTEMGKIAGLVDTAEEAPTPLQEKLSQLGRFVAAACLIVCAAVACLGWLQGNDFLTMLLTGVSLAVAAIPEGLPAIVTITLALSVGRILRRGAVIRRLHAVETLGCAGVICTDKTGTITQNKMTVQRIWVNDHEFTVTGSGAQCDGQILENGAPASLLHTRALALLLEAGALCSTAQIHVKGKRLETSGDPTEVAVLVAAAKAGIEKNILMRTHRITAETPFDSTRKRMSVVVKKGRGQEKLVCKGAPDVLLERCERIMDEGGERAMTSSDRERIRRKMERMAKSALRVLAFAENSPQGGEEKMCFLGLMGMMDPPRPEVRAAVRKCRAAGIKPVMITGDAPQTALAVARSVEIAHASDRVVTGAELENMSDDELRRICMKTPVYARVSPEHKLRIVRAYKSVGQITAMTGDGVNDSPAVKEADIGVAMGKTGTDVTKEASGVVILDDNFATIVSAVEEGRVIYQNIRRFVRYLLTSNLGEVTGMLFAMLLNLPVMLLPIQILLVNLFTDGLPAIALGLEPPSEDIMEQPPRPKQEGLFAHGLGAVIALRGALLGAAACACYGAVLMQSGDLLMARSACFLTVVFSQMLHLFECRGRGLHFGGNPWLCAAAACSVLLAVLCVYAPALQPLFSTCALGISQLVWVAAAVAVGPVLAAVIRTLFGIGKS